MGSYKSPVAPGVPFLNSGTSFYYDNVEDALIENRQLITYDPEFITTSLNGNSNLVFTNKTLQIVTGTQTGHSVILPNATTLFNGRKYEIANQSNQPIGIKDFSGFLLFNLNPQSVAMLTLQSNSTSAGVWISVVVSTIASGIQSYNVISSTPFTTSSLTYVVVTGFSITPLSGTYGVWVSSDTNITQNNALLYYTIFRDGVQVLDSERIIQGVSSNFKSQLNTLSIINFNGLQSCDMRVRTTTGSIAINQRSMLLIRLGV